MKKLLLLLMASIAVTGCASTDYKQYVLAQQSIETARHNADAERYKALAAIAASGTETAKVAAVMSLQRGGETQQAAQLRAPEAAGESILRWAGVLMPAITNLGVTAMNVNAQRHASDNATALGIAQSNNSTALGVSTNNAFSNIANGGFAALSTTSTAGFGALGTTASAGFASNSSISAAGFASNGAIAGHIQAPAANVTNTTTNFTTDNHATDSHNSSTTNTTSTSTASTTSTDSHNSTATTSTSTTTTCAANGASSGTVNGTTTPTSGTGGSGTTNC